MAAMVKYRTYTATLPDDRVIRKGIAFDSDELNDEGPHYFFAAGAVISDGPIIHIEEFPGLDDVHDLTIIHAVG